MSEGSLALKAIRLLTSDPGLFVEKVMNRVLARPGARNIKKFTNTVSRSLDQALKELRSLQVRRVLVYGDAAFFQEFCLAGTD
jgi:hypothetical protein